MIHLLSYFALFLVAFVVLKLLFSYDAGSDTEVPHLIVQKGNDHFFRANISTFPKPKSFISSWRQKGTGTGHSLEKFGKLNVHIWEEICGESLGSLRNHALFPNLPSRRTRIKKTVFFHSEKNQDFGERIFGFLHPKRSGVHSFRVRGASFEVWISTDSNPLNSRLISRQESKENVDITTVVFELLLENKDPRYIEILHKKGQKYYRFVLQWKAPGSLHYSELSGTDISLMLDDQYLSHGQVDVDLPIQTIPHIHRKDPFPAYDSFEKPRATLHQLPILDGSWLDGILPTCEYKPSYIVDRVLRYYHGVWETHYSSLYPVDKSNLTRLGWISLGNDELAKEKALAVVAKFMEALNKAKRQVSIFL